MHPPCEPILEIVHRANASGILGKRGKHWTHRTVEYVLQNPFYAGKTFYARGKINERGVYHVKPDAQLHDGKHEPLWSWNTYLKIMREFERRARLRQSRQDYNLTGLLKCAECDATLTIMYEGRKGSKRYWHCPNRHVSIRTDRANAQVAAELQRLFASDEMPVFEVVQRTNTDRQITEIRRQLTRLEQAYTAGAYTADEYATRRKGLKAREAELLDEVSQKELEELELASRKQTFTTMRELRAVFPRWVAEAEPRTVKFHLSRMVKLTAHKDKTIRAEFV